MALTQGPDPRVARPLLAAVAALALGLPAPALAEGDAERSIRNVALGLAALAVLGLALRERGEDEAREAKALPGACLRPVPTDEGPVGLYDPGCLDDRFEGASRLPLSCAVTVRSEGRIVSGFAPACLADEGFRVARD